MSRKCTAAKRLTGSGYRLAGMVSRVGRGMGVLDGAGDHRREGAVWGVNLGRPIATNGDGDALFPNYFGEDLFHTARVRQRVCVVTVQGGAAARFAGETDRRAASLQRDDVEQHAEEGQAEPGPALLPAGRLADGPIPRLLGVRRL